MIKKTLVVLNIAGLIGSLIWLMTHRSWEPLVASIGFVASLITLLFTGRQNSDKTFMNQKGGKGSTNYQSKRDMNIKIKK